MEEDIELVEKVKKGDILAYELLVKKYEVKLFWFLRRWTDDEHIIEETVQDALFKIYTNINRVDKKRGFSAYLYTIAKNQLMDRFRVEKKTLTLLENVVGKDESHIYEEIDRDIEKDRINSGLRQLKEMQRRILEMYFFEELSYKKMEEVLGVPLNTIKTNIRRAKLALLSILKNEKK